MDSSSSNSSIQSNCVSTCCSSAPAAVLIVQQGCALQGHPRSPSLPTWSHQLDVAAALAFMLQQLQLPLALPAGSSCGCPPCSSHTPPSADCRFKLLCVLQRPWLLAVSYVCSPAVLCYAQLCCAMLNCAVLCSPVLECPWLLAACDVCSPAVLCCAMLRYVMLCYIMHTCA